MNEGAGQHDEDDDGECDSQRCLDVEELAVEDEACQPEGEVQPVYAFFAVVLLQDEVIRKKDGCHRSEDGSDEVQEFLETARVHHDSKADAACAGDKGERFFRKSGNQCLSGNAGRECIQECRRDSRKKDNQDSDKAHTCLKKDLGDIILPGIESGAHTDDEHPGACGKVSQAARCRCFERFLRDAGIVGNDRKPGKRHSHRELYRCAKRHVSHSLRHMVSHENHTTQDKRQKKESRNHDHIHLPQILESKDDPESNESADDDTCYGTFCCTGSCGSWS